MNWGVEGRRCGGSCVFVFEAFSMFYIRGLRAEAPLSIVMMVLILTFE